MTDHMTASATGPANAPQRDERGDVPGWVLVTVMSVGLVTIITQLARDELQAILRAALGSVTW